jgi:hypothetical protein
VIPNCADDSSGALGCNDDDLDGSGYASTVTLANVPAGDYSIIVESGQLEGGVYGVSATVK